MASELISQLPKTYLPLRDAFVQKYQDLMVVQTEIKSELQYSQSNLVYQLVKEACFMLGFIEADAQCIALAHLKYQSDINLFDINFWPSHPELFGLKGPQLKDGFPSCPKNLGLYVVAPDARWIEKLLRAGIQTVQLRFKSSNPTAIRAEVTHALEIAKQFSCQLFINDYWELAIELGAYGVHLGQEDLDKADLQKIKAANIRLGVSTHGYAEMIRADQLSPSYIAMGAIFPTTLKTMPTAPQGLARFKKYAQLMQSYPLVGIGGINEDKIKAVLDVGVGSVAMVRSVINAPDYELAISQLQTYFRQVP